MSHDGLTPIEPVSHPQGRRYRRRMRASRMIRVVPSLLTLGNLICGFSSIFWASRPASVRVFGDYPPLTIAAALLFLGMLFDALDGRVARMTRQTSELGEQLDSMSDMVSFGVAPAFLVVQLVGSLTNIDAPFLGNAGADNIFGRMVYVIAAVYAACAALRLARFNIEIENPDEADHMTFKGLPSPAAAGTVASLVLLHESLVHHDFIIRAKITAVTMVAVCLLAAVAMVSTVRYPHVMNKYLRGRAPFHYVAFALIILIPLLIIPQLTLAVAFVGFAAAAPVIALINRARGRRPARVGLPRPQPTGTDDAPPTYKIG